MKKLSLALDDIQVDSFVADTLREWGGTLHPFEANPGGKEKEGSFIVSCRGSCDPTCNEMEVSCKQSCEPTCNPLQVSCKGSCDPTCSPLEVSCVRPCQ